jgi:hypothetical protein
VREILRRVKPEDDFAWARLATIMSIRTLKDRLPGVAEAENLLTHLNFELSPEMRMKWEQGIELASRLYGCDVGPSGFLDICCMEFQSGAWKALYDALDAEDRPTGSLMTLDELEQWKADGEREAERRASALIRQVRPPQQGTSIVAGPVWSAGGLARRPRRRPSRARLGGGPETAGGPSVLCYAHTRTPHWMLFYRSLLPGGGT